MATTDRIQPWMIPVIAFGCLFMLMCIVLGAWILGAERRAQVASELRVSRTEATFEILRQKYRNFYNDKKRDPANMEELWAAYSALSPRIEFEVAVDGWKRQFIYSIDERGPVIISLGADGVVGGVGFDADISNRQRPEWKIMERDQ